MNKIFIILTLSLISFSLSARTYSTVSDTTDLLYHIHSYKLDLLLELKRQVDNRRKNEWHSNDYWLMRGCVYYGLYQNKEITIEDKAIYFGEWYEAFELVHDKGVPKKYKVEYQAILVQSAKKVAEWMNDTNRSDSERKGYSKYFKNIKRWYMKTRPRQVDHIFEIVQNI